MTGPSQQEITRLLRAWSDGDRSALDRLVPLVYEELHRAARRYMRRERDAQTIQTTALVNEVYLRLVDAKDVRWQGRAHFFGIAARLMRQILVDVARRRAQLKRGGGADRVTLDDAVLGAGARPPDLVALDDALTALAALDPRQSQVVEMRFFGGLTEDEIAEVLGVSPRTVRADWSMARAWLLRELSRGEGG